MTIPFSPTPDDERDTVEPKPLTREERRALCHKAAEVQTRIGAACLKLQSATVDITSGILELADIADALEGVSTP